MRFIISLSIVLIAFDATKIRRIKQALSVQVLPYKLELFGAILKAMKAIFTYIILNLYNND
jgi:hypothetical protein